MTPIRLIMEDDVWCDKCNKRKRLSVDGSMFPGGTKLCAQCGYDYLKGIGYWSEEE